MDAVIDIGSNSVRLFVESGKAVTPKKLNTTQLAQGLANTGKLNNEAMVHTADAVANFFVDAKTRAPERFISSVRRPCAVPAAKR